MEVVKESFADQFATIREAILSCDFVSIDTELTGLAASKHARIHALDTVEERYAKLRESAAKFMTIQWGLCAFTKSSTNSNEYIARPFNFFVFPKPFHPNLDYTFLSSVSSLHFLAGNKFDFNKLIYHGLPWLRRDEEDRIRASRMSAAARDTANEDIALGEKENVFVDALCEQIDAWLKTDATELRLAPCNSFLRRITYQELAKRYNNTLYASARTDEGSHQRYIIISRLSEEEKKAKEHEKAQQSDMEVEEAVGFRRVLDVLVEAKKPLVGHNLLLDLVHTFSFLFSLPATSQQFKRELHDLFPTIVDTKYLVSNSPALAERCSSTALGDTYAAFNQPQYASSPTIATPDDYNAYASDESRLHEAGYDAYITGISYLRMAHQLAGLNGETSSMDLLPTAPGMQKYANKMFLLRSDIPFFNLLGPDPEPNRTGLLYVHSFAPSLRTGEIVRYFASFGRVFVNWIDDTSLFVTFAESSLAPRALDHVCALEPRPPFEVCDYATYAQWRSEPGFPASPIKPPFGSSNTAELAQKKRKRSASPAERDDELEEGEIPDHPQEDGAHKRRRKDDGDDDEEAAQEEEHEDAPARPGAEAERGTCLLQ